jgi:hypothetical protein
MKRGWDRMEVCYEALAMEDRKSGGAPVSSGWGKVGNVTIPQLAKLKEEVEEMVVSLAELVVGLETWWRCDDARERVRAAAEMAAPFSPLCRREREGGGNGWVRSGRRQSHPSRHSAAGQGARSRAARGGHAAAMACGCR